MPGTAPLILGALAALIPLAGPGDYYLHMLVMIFLWSFVYTAWSVMGRFGLVSLGHGAFFGIGAYGVTLLWNHLGLSPWLGAPISVAVAAVVALAIGYPCFRFRITGHYFGLVTLALSQIVLLLIVALRDVTGGSLGATPRIGLEGGATVSIVAMQFAQKEVWFYAVLVLWLVGVAVWRAVDRSMLRFALEAAGQDEDAAASIGIDVTRTKLSVTVLSAVMTTLGGVVYAQYQLYVNPETVSGIGISLQMVFAVVAGGMFVQLGPTVGAIFTLLLTESLRVMLGNDIHGLDGVIYGALLVLFIIHLPKGILGTVLANLRPAPKVPAHMPATSRAS